MGSESNPVSVIFDDGNENKELLISTKSNAKTLCTFFSPQKSLKTLQLKNKIEAWNVINNNYLSCLVVLWSGQQVSPAALKAYGFVSPLKD